MMDNERAERDVWDGGSAPIEEEEMMEEPVEREFAEDELLESQRKLSTLMSNLPGMAYRCRNEPDWPMEFVSEGAEDLTGYAPEDLIESRLVAYGDLIHPDDQDLVWEAVQTGVEAHESFQVTYRIRDADGETRWVWEQGRGVFSDDGELMALEGFISDITERRRAEEELQQSRVQMETLLEAIPDLMFRLDREGVFVDFHAGRGELALPPEAFLGQKIEDVLPAHVAQLTKEHIDKVLASGKPATYEYRLPRMEDDVLRDYEARMVVSDENEVLAIIRDVTERKRAERALQYRAEFEDLIANVSTQFVNVEPHQVDAEINEALRDVGEFTAVDRSYLFLFSEDGNTMSNTHEWCAEGISSHIDDLQGVPTDAFPWLMERLQRLEDVLVPRVADLPDAAELEKREFESEGIQSLIVVPATYQGELVGFLGFDAVEEERGWSEDEAVLLRLVGETFVNALERRQTERAQQARLERIQRQQQAITKLATHEALVSGDWEEALAVITETVAETMDVERVSIWMMDENQRAITCEDLFERTSGAHSEGLVLEAEDCPAYFVAMTNERTIDADLALTDPRTSEFADGYLKPLGITSMLDSAIRMGGETIGVVCHEHVGEPRDWRPDEITFAGAIADQVVQVLANAERRRLERQIQKSLERRAQQVELTTEIAQEIAGAPELGSLYERVVTLVKEHLGYYHVQIFRYDEEFEAMRVVEGYGDAGDKMKAAGHHLPYGEGVVGTAAATGNPVLASDVTADPYWKPHPDLPATEGELAIPIKLRDEVLGVLDVQSDQAGALTEEDQVMLLGLAGQIASAIESTNLLAEVQESQQFLDTIIDNIPNPIFYQNAEGIYLGCNEAFLEYLGMPDGEVRGKTVYDLTPDQELAEIYHEMDLQMIEEMGAESYEAQIEYADGSVRDVVFYRTTFQNPDGSVGGLISTFLDISDLKETEKALQRSEERYRSYINNAPDGIFISDEQGRYLEVNEAACRITGYSREELLGMQIIDLLPPESMEEAGAHFQRLAETGKATGDFKFIKKGGAERYWTVDAVKLSDTRFLGFTKDITERVRVEQMLNKRVKELNCLTDVGQYIAEEPAIPDLLRWAAGRIPSAMRYPEVCVTAVEFEGQVYGQPEALDLPCHVVSALRIPGGTVGHLYVAYEEERDFIDEESAMLGGVVRRLESYIEQRRAAQQVEKRARQLAAVAEVASSTGVTLDPDELIRHTAEMVRDRFDLYYVGLFMVDETGEWTDEPGEWAVLRTGTGEAGRQMLEDEHKLKINGDSMIGWCIANQEPRIALDVGEEAARFENPYLPETRSELALPIVARGDVIGALSIQSMEAEAFSEEDITVFQTMVDQVATAIENARLFEQTQEALDRTESLYEGSGQVTRAQEIDEILEILIQSTALRRLDRANFLLFDRSFLPGEHPDAFTVEAVWEREGGEPRAPVGTRYDFEQFPAARVVDRRDPTIVSDVATDERIDDNTRELILKRLGSRGITFWPLVVGEQWIGLVTGQASEVLDLNEGEIRQITSLVDQAAAVIQNIRLLEQTEARARREETLREITDHVRGLTDPDAIVRAAVRELGTALGRPTFARLGSAQELAQPPTDGEDGDDGMADD